MISENRELFQIIQLLYAFINLFSIFMQKHSGLGVFEQHSVRFVKKVEGWHRREVVEVVVEYARQVVAHIPVCGHPGFGLLPYVSFPFGIYGQYLLLPLGYRAVYSRIFGQFTQDVGTMGAFRVVEYQQCLRSVKPMQCSPGSIPVNVAEIGRYRSLTVKGGLSHTLFVPYPYGLRNPFR